MSQSRVRLRALASLGLSIILFAALAPATAASGFELASPAVAPAAAPEATLAAAPATGPIAALAISGPAALAALRRRLGEDLAPTDALSSAPQITSPAAVSVSRPASVAASTRVIALAESHLGARYQHGATGPRAFDCSGLVYRVFEDAGLGRMIAGLRSASALYAHFRARHMTSTVNPQPGDLVIFGGGSHVGIYIGNGRVVHAMVTGVAITRISAVYPEIHDVCPPRSHEASTGSPASRAHEASQGLDGDRAGPDDGGPVVAQRSFDRGPAPGHPAGRSSSVGHPDLARPSPRALVRGDRAGRPNRLGRRAIHRLSLARAGWIDSYNRPMIDGGQDSVSGS